jgi:RNA polymerase sigma factor (TIGR02999 family)
MYQPETPAADAGRSHQVTLALQAARGGDPLALNEAFHLVYEEVRGIARARLARAGAASTLDTTAVVHEAYLKLARHGGMAWEDRQHFLAVASTAMRQVLLDHARQRLAARRGGGAAHVPLTEADAVVESQAREILSLDAALLNLARLDPQLAHLVELRYFGGLTIEETAQALGISDATVKRAWRRARAFLHRELTGAGASPGGHDDA